MRIAIVGSRGFQDYNFLTKCLSGFQGEITTIVSGGALGADLLGKRYAQEHNIPYMEFLPEWDNLNVPGAVIRKNKFGKPYNATAGMRRNYDIIVNSDVVFAFWDGKSKGTRNSIEHAKNLKKNLHLFIQW